MNFNTFMPTRVISGEGCVKDFKFSRMGKRAFIMCGRTGASKCGLLRDLTETLTAQNIQYKIFSQVGANPTVSSCYSAAYEAYSFEADFIIGAGGGSAMDAAKAAAVFAANSELRAMDLFTKPVRTALPLVLIGTTAGTGSEVTPYSVLTITDDKGNPKKKSFKNPVIYAKYALCDASYTATLDWETTKNTALDAICHGVESLFSNKADEFDIMYALKAVEKAYGALKKAHWQRIYENREISADVRQQALFASILGGMAINGTGTCFPHALGYALTNYYDIPHGKATAFFLGDFIRRISVAAPQRLQMLSSAIDEEDIETFITGINSLVGEGPALSLADIERFTDEIAGYPSLESGVVSISSEDVRSIYKKIFFKY